MDVCREPSKHACGLFAFFLLFFFSFFSRCSRAPLRLWGAGRSLWARLTAWQLAERGGLEAAEAARYGLFVPSYGAAAASVQGWLAPHATLAELGIQAGAELDYRPRRGRKRNERAAPWAYCATQMQL